MHRKLAALTLAAGTFAGALAGSSAGAAPPVADVDQLAVSTPGASMSSTMTWTKTTYQGAAVDNGEHTLQLVKMNRNTCATLKVSWFDGTDPVDVASEMITDLGCGSISDPTALYPLQNSRFNVPPARKAVVCLTSRSILGGIGQTSCVTSLAFADDRHTGI